MRRALFAIIGVVLLLAVGAAPAASHPTDDDLVPAGANEADLRAIEAAALGAEHAAEHAAARRTARRVVEGELSVPGEPQLTLSSEAVAAPAAAGPPAEVGEWTQPPFQIPNYAIHSVVLPTGKVLFWGRPPLPAPGAQRPNFSEAALWDPSLGTGPGSFTDVDPPVIDVDGPGGQAPAKAPIFCSGQTLLPSGEVVAAGGTLIYAGTFPDDAYTDWGGLQTIFTFDPFSETWVRQPDMAEGRWYPGQVMLPDGRTVILSGLSDEAPGGLMTNSVEVFNPPATIGGQGTVDQEPSAFRNGLGLYPRTFTFGDDVIVTGPSKALTATLDSDSFTWNESLQTMSRSRIAGNAVRRPVATPSGSDTVTTIGGFDRSEGSGPYYAGTTTTETIDARAATPSWSTDAPLNVGRANSNTVLLPDGSMVVVGGGSGYELGGGGGYTTYADGRARQIEVYDPDSDSWLLGPAQEEDRTYHSTAVLLPDGRVFSAGDDHYPLEPGGEFSVTDNAEIYSPPYLFKGPRPEIDSAPQLVDWGDAFGIESQSGGIERAVLMSPGATTHAFDMHQRHVELQVVNELPGQGVDVLSPPSDAAAPPGYYMLFLLNADGVPSEASWIRIDPTAPDQPTLGPPPQPPAGDFNGDGVADQAIGVPLEDVGSTPDAGAVNVVYGSAGGLTQGGNQLFTQTDLGGGQAAESGDRFGAALASADFDQDGFADLAVGAPREDIGATADTGAVNVLYGSASGLTATGSQTFSQGSGGIADSAEAGDQLGASLAAGDLDGDGDGDLGAGVPAESVGSIAGAGAVNVIYGSGAGLSSTGNQLFHQDSAGIVEVAESGDSFGAALASGDLNGDSRDDLAVGAPSEAVTSVAGAGSVNVIHGSASGLTSSGNQVWSQNSAGIADAAESGDRMGAALASGNLNGDSRDDLAIGVSSESIGSASGAGAVHAIYGSAAGLASAGSQFWSQNSTDVKDAAEANDRLGSALAAGDLDGDLDDDLLVGAPGESIGTAAAAGGVNMLLGSGGGLSSTGNLLWSQNSAAISEVSEAGDSFGAALATADLNDDARDDLAIGVPSESIGTIAAGALNMIYGSGSGLSSAGNQLWSQDSTGVLDQAEAGDQFGAALGAAR